MLGAALSVVHAGLAHGPRTALGLLLLVGGTAVAFEAVGLATGFPYGRYTYSDALGPTLLGVPFLVPLAWLMMAWPSWILAERLARPVGRKRRAVVRIAAAAGVFAAWDVVLDPQMVQAGYWTWEHPRPGLPGIDTVPLTNLAGWLLAGVVLMSLLDLLVARSSVRDAPRIGAAAPLLALGWMTLGGALAHAGWLGLPGSAAWGAGLAVPVLRRPARAGAAGGQGPPVSGRTVRVLAGLSVAGALHAALNMALLRRPPADPPPLRRPVTVVVPVRDEEAQIGGCLAALLDQRGRGRPPGRGRRRRLHRRHRGRGPLVRRPADPAPGGRAAPGGLAGQAARLRVRRRPRPRRRRPPDEVLVFVDADVRLFPDAVAGAVAVLERHGLDLVSPWPRPLAVGSRRAPGAAARRRGCGRPPCRCGWPSGRRARRWPRRTGSSWCSPAPGTTGPGGTPPSAGTCSRTSPCCVR